MEINIQHVNYKYYKKHVGNTLNDINLTINATGEFITILGHTGSGKSTLAQVLNALLIPNSGTITIFGKVIKPKNKKPLKEIRNKVGLVFQFPEYQLFEETVLDDIMFGPKNFGKKKEEAKTEALKVVEKLNIPEELLTRPPFNLSGGQKRKVAIAGILASNPDILILDEPTVGLDPVGRSELLSLLEQIHKETNKTIIIITHNMDVVTRVSTRSIVLKKGQVVFDGTPKELFNNQEHLNEFNLDLPYISKIALELKEKGLVHFDSIPLTVDELHQIIEGEENDK